MPEIKSIADIIKEVREPEIEHTLIYDSTSESLEPIYFFILDLMNDFGLAPEKLVDNFVSSPGSGHFAELGQRATIMQQNASRILGDVNTVLRSILNLVYDLKEFKMRLEYYDDLKSKDKNISEAARLSLKQIWLDKVDITKGNSALKAMTIQGGFQTLLDAFLFANTPGDVDKIDLNDIVKRILKPRIQEFNIWVEQSERELRKRYELEKNYLRSQVSSLKIYSRWAKPYLKAAQKLEMKDSQNSPELVNAFNTIMLELTLLGKNKIDFEKSINSGDLPPELKKMGRTLKRNYYSCVLVDFSFRGIPRRISPQESHYVFGGKTRITFRGYSLNDDELNLIQEEIKKSDVEDILKLIEGTTSESLDQIQEEINSFLEEAPIETKTAPTQKARDTSNPFFALLGKYEKKGGGFSQKTEKSKKILPDSFIEKEHIRPLATEKAIETTFNLFDIYKKAHGMPSYS